MGLKGAPILAAALALGSNEAVAETADGLPSSRNAGEELRTTGKKSRPAVQPTQPTAPGEEPPPPEEPIVLIDQRKILEREAVCTDAQTKRILLARQVMEALSGTAQTHYQEVLQNTNPRTGYGYAEPISSYAPLLDAVPEISCSGETFATYVEGGVYTPPTLNDAPILARREGGVWKITPEGFRTDRNLINAVAAAYGCEVYPNDYCTFVTSPTGGEYQTPAGQAGAVKRSFDEAYGQRYATATEIFESEEGPDIELRKSENPEAIRARAENPETAPLGDLEKIQKGKLTGTFTLKDALNGNDYKCEFVQGKLVYLEYDAPDGVGVSVSVRALGQEGLGVRQGQTVLLTSGKAEVKTFHFGSERNFKGTFNSKGELVGDLEGYMSRKEEKFSAKGTFSWKLNNLAGGVEGFGETELTTEKDGQKITFVGPGSAFDVYNGRVNEGSTEKIKAIYSNGMIAEGMIHPETLLPYGEKVTLFWPKEGNRLAVVRIQKGYLVPDKIFEYSRGKYSIKFDEGESFDGVYEDRENSMPLLSGATASWPYDPNRKFRLSAGLMTLENGLKLIEEIIPSSSD